MLIFTNREIEVATNAPVFTKKFQPGAETLGVAQVLRSGSGFLLSQVQPNLNDDAAMHLLVALFGGKRRVLIYLHGNNNLPSTCFERCARLEEIYNLEVIGFSWTSEGYLSSGEDLPNIAAAVVTVQSDEHEYSLADVDANNRKESWAQRKIRHYHQAKINAQDSGDALARFFRLLGAARLYVNHQPMTIAAHSLGCHFLQYAIENESTTESLGAAHNIALLAACCRADGHEGWIRKIVPKGQVFITFNKGDSVLFGASIADGQQTKLGTEPGTRIVSSKVRYVSFTNAKVGFGGHGYFVWDAGDKVPKTSKKLFDRMFGSERDIQENQGEYPRKIYPVGCDENGSTCYMADPSLESLGS